MYDNSSLVLDLESPADDNRVRQFDPISVARPAVEAQMNAFDDQAKRPEANCSMPDSQTMDGNGTKTGKRPVAIMME